MLIIYRIQVNTEHEDLLFRTDSGDPSRDPKDSVDNGCLDEVTMPFTPLFSVTDGQFEVSFTVSITFKETSTGP